ncbi:hypothetical protein [Halovivax cerinus]|uniref:Uncharacterized protein n=1 Tax=Halovivax cerinus TaxID=1487865 RepID=A0ABD5NJJ1_9EURY|nr:hypothetical protein [Halovivax cerinus]
MAIHFGKGTRVFAKTLPFVLLRMGVGALFGLLAVLYFGVVAWVLFTLVDGGSISGMIALVGLLLAAGFFAWVVRLARRYVLYLVSAGHIAVIAHILDTGAAPDSQLSYGIGQVKENFASASALFAVDQLVKGVIKQFNRAVASLANWVSFVPALKNIIEILRRAIAMAASYIDEAILAHIFLSDEPNNWRAARDGVVLYGKTWKPVLTATIIIVVGMYVAAFVGLLLLTPLASVLGNLSPTFEYAGWIMVAGIALTGYLGFLRPWVKTVVITTFILEARDETPDSQTVDDLVSKSEKFSELMAKAESEEAAETDPDAPEPKTPGSAA